MASLGWLFSWAGNLRGMVWYRWGPFIQARRHRMRMWWESQPESRWNCRGRRVQIAGKGRKSRSLWTDMRLTSTCASLSLYVSIDPPRGGLQCAVPRLAHIASAKGVGEQPGAPSNQRRCRTGRPPKRFESAASRQRLHRLRPAASRLELHVAGPVALQRQRIQPNKGARPSPDSDDWIQGCPSPIISPPARLLPWNQGWRVTSCPRCPSHIKPTPSFALQHMHPRCCQPARCCFNASNSTVPRDGLDPAFRNLYAGMLLPNLGFCISSED